MKVNHSSLITSLKGVGFTLLEMGFICALSTGLIGLGAMQAKHRFRRQVNQETAYQLRKITDAAKQYVRDHYESIHQTASSGFESKFTIEELQSAGYLDDSVQLSNSFKQTYQIQVAATELSDQPTQLSILVLSQGGAEIPQEDAQAIAGYAGGDAGYIDRRTDGTALSGSGGIWIVDGIANGAYGHIGSLNFVREHEILDANSFLMRKKIDNHPEYNQMQTDLDMQSKSIKGCSGDCTYQISATSGMHLIHGEESANYDPTYMTLTDNIGRQLFACPNRIEFTEKGGLNQKIWLDKGGMSMTSGNNSAVISAQGIVARAPAGTEYAVDFTNLSISEATSSRLSELTGTYLQIPVYEINGSYGSWRDLITPMCTHGNPTAQQRYGRMFIVGVHSYPQSEKRLVICSHKGAMLLSIGEEIFLE